MGSGLPLGTAQKPQRRVQRLPSIMKVAVLWFQHSPMLGQWADSQTVWRLRSRASFLSAWKVSPTRARALSQASDWASGATASLIVDGFAAGCLDGLVEAFADFRAAEVEEEDNAEEAA